MEKEPISHFGIVDIMRVMVLCVSVCVFRSISRFDGDGTLELLVFMLTEHN